MSASSANSWTTLPKLLASISSTNTNTNDNAIAQTPTASSTTSTSTLRQQPPISSPATPSSPAPLSPLSPTFPSAAYMGAFSTEGPSTTTEGSPSSAGGGSGGGSGSGGARGLLSRFSFPLRSRARNLADFHIRPDEPHRQYSAGEHVRGAVVLAVVKPVRITHLTVALHGFVKVYKGPAVTEPAVPLPTSPRFQYHGNGHASLFQDEQVLSGEGRLEPGKYEFNFDLMFPEKGLPSSIDFERGTISYMITAILTRPTSISPTSTCERKVSLVEKVDIGELQPQRPRTIYLEPISKRTRRKKSTGPEKAPSITAVEMDAVSDMESAEPSLITEEPATDSSVAANAMSPAHSDIRSEFSGDSSLGSSTGTGLSVRPADSATQAGGNNSVGHTHTQSAKMQTVDEKTITATIELLRPGCIPGDTVSIKVSVQHIKRIKSMHGVIVTLYRQGRIDSSPPSSAFSSMLSKEETARLEKEEFYPRSKTGLGGLSLTSTTSLSVFRKDLSQAVAPLIIDPITLDTSITASVKVPEDVFPTIKGVPGDMISFKYQLEVIVDLGGRLASQIQGGGQPTRLGALSTANNAPGQDNTVVTSWNGSLVDTDRLRREKGVISVVFEVVVGTDDSSRQRGRAASRPLPPPSATYTQQEDALGEDNMTPASWTNGPADDYAERSPYYAPTAPPGAAAPSSMASRQSNFSNQPPLPPPPVAHAATTVPEYIPPPEETDESSLPEKERLRRAEARLLPSQPGGPSSSSTSALQPAWSSAPPPEALSLGDGLSPPPAPPLPTAPGLAPGPLTPLPSGPNDDNGGEGPSAPSVTDLDVPRIPAADDKQELERQRLLTEASAPPEFPEDYEAGSGRPVALPLDPSGNGSFEPTAPVLSDEHEYGEQYTFSSAEGSSTPAGHANAVAEPLPRYEK